MVNINKRLYELEKDDLFSNVINQVNEYKKENPNKKIVSLGVGDVSTPIIKPIIGAMHKAVEDLANMETFKGYGAYDGYDFLKEKILKHEYKNMFTAEEIYISCGTKTDTTNILELFDVNASIAITNPMYPAHLNGAICLSRNVELLPLSKNKEFISALPKKKYDLIYICSPNNPVGIAYTKEDLKEFIDYAKKNDCVILYDNVYESFITSENVPRSIYEIEGSKSVAIEFRSYSKNASFSGIRCSYYIIPNDIHSDINRLWKERTINRYNGTDYIVQRGAEAVYLPISQELISENVANYSKNTMYLRSAFIDLGFEVWGGIDAPYMWIKTPNNENCWDFFNYMLKELNIVVIPGLIFGDYGDKYFRVSGLGTREEIEEAVRRLKNNYER